MGQLKMASLIGSYYRQAVHFKNYQSLQLVLGKINFRKNPEVQTTNRI